MTDRQTDDDTYPDAEADARREATLKQMLRTPHKPHQPTKRKPKESQGK